MDTHRIRYFCIIAETGSLTAAAEILNISHSGLSKAMSVLQQELGQRLFKPQGRGLELTPAGKSAYHNCKEVLQAIDRMMMAEPAPKARVRIGMAEVFALHLSGRIAEIFQVENTGLEITEMDSGEAETAILAGKIDFGISFVPFPHRDLEYLKIKSTQLGVFGKKSVFANLELSEIPFVVPNSEIQSNPLSLKNRDGWPSGLPRHEVFGASQLSIALSIAEQGLAAVFMPRFLAPAGLVEFEVKRNLFQASERDIFIVKKKNDEESKAMKAVARLIRTHC